MSEQNDLIKSLAEANDYGNCLWVMAQTAGKILYTAGRGWMVWCGTHWHPDEAQAKRDVTESLRARAVEGVKRSDDRLTKSAFPSTKHIRDAMFLLQAYVAVDDAEFRQVVHHLNFQNGLVDMRTGDLIPHDHAQRQTYCLDIEYEPGAESELWEQCISQWIGGDINLRQYLHRLMGYAATGETSEEILLYIYGPPRSGKGTFLNTIHAVLGPLAASTDMDTFIDRRSGRNFALASLIEARFVQAQETRTDQWLNTALLKSATGRDPLSVEQKYKTPYTAIPVWLIVLASNYPPKAPPDDTAFWETRMRVIAFPNSNSGAEDRTLKNRLLSDENRRGIAAWLVRGAMAWYRHGLGPVPTTITETTQQMRSLSDSLGRWLTDACVMEADAESTAKQLHTAYTMWCDDEGIPQAERHPQAELMRRLNVRGLSVRRTTVGGRGGTSGYVVRGIRLA